MNLDDLLKWIMDHNLFLIEVLFLAIGATVSFVLFRSVVSGKDDVANGGPSLNEIEKTLRKVLDNTTLKSTATPPPTSPSSMSIQDSDGPAPSAPPAGAGATAAGPALTPQQIETSRVEVESLKVELQKRESSLKELQKSLEDAKQAAAQPGVQVDVKGMEAQLKELQAKLAEYEIIEDDIANLSTYKSENSKLKGELEAIKGRLGSKVAESGGTSANVKQFAALMGEETPGTVPPPPSTTPKAKPAVEAAAPPPAEAAAEEDTPPADVPDVAEKAAASADAALGDLDPDKLLAETKDLPESATLPAEEGDQGEKLINEFENFMKGS